MATMYSLFLGILFTAVCSFKYHRNSVLDVFKSSLVNGFYSLYQGRDFHFFLDEKTKQKNQGLVARLNCLLISGNKTNSLRSDRSDCLSEIIDNSLRLAQPRPIYSDTARSSLQSRLMSPVKHFAVKNDLLAYGIKGRKATSYNSVHFALGQESQSKGGIGGLGTLGTACVALLSRDEHRVNSLDFFVLFDQAKSTSSSGDEDNNKIRNNKTLLAESRQSILEIASKELGTREATGNNDGSRVEEYHETYHSCPDYRGLHYHNLYHFLHFFFLPNAKGEG